MAVNAARNFERDAERQFVGSRRQDIHHDLRLLALESSGIGTWYWNAQLDERSWDRECKRLFGFDQDGPTPTREEIFSRTHPEDAERLQQEIMRARKDGGDYDHSYRLLLPEGEIRWIRAKGRAQHGHDGQLLSMQGIVFDITDLKEAEAEKQRLANEVENQRKRLSTIIEYLPVGVMLAEAPSGRIVAANPRLEQIIGHAALLVPEVNAYSSYVGFHPDGRRVLASDWPLARALKGEIIHDQEFLYHRPDGREVWISISGAPIRDASGAIVGSLIALRDIEAEKRSQELQRQLHNEKLAAKLALTLAHEINNPLEVLTNAVYLLSTGLPGEGDLRRYVDLAEASVRRVNEMSSNLLNLYSGKRADRKQLRDILDQQSNFDLLFAILENLPDAALAADSKGTIKFMNRSAVKLYGVPKGNDCAIDFGVYHPQTGKLVSNSELPLFRALSGEQVQDVELTIRPQAGGAYNVKASGFPLRTAEGDLLGGCVITRVVKPEAPDN